MSIATFFTESTTKSQFLRGAFQLILEYQMWWKGGDLSDTLGRLDSAHRARRTCGCGHVGFMSIDAHICGHVGCVLAEKSDGAMKKPKSPQKSPFFDPHFTFRVPKSHKSESVKNGDSFYYLLRLIATWGASCRHDSASPKTGAWQSLSVFQPLTVVVCLISLACWNIFWCHK